MEKNRLKKLIIPLVLEQLLNVSVGFIDTFMVSKVGEAAVSDTKFLLKLAYCCEWVCNIALFFFAPFIVSLFSLSKEACDSAVLVLRCFSIVSLFIWPLSYTLPNALRGAGDVKYSMVISIIAMWLGRVLTSYCLVKYFSLGILGIWIGMFADWIIRSIGYMYRFISGIWLNKKVI